jgi:hypothetical protein
MRPRPWATPLVRACNTPHRIWTTRHSPRPLLHLPRLSKLPSNLKPTRNPPHHRRKCRPSSPCSSSRLMMTTFHGGTRLAGASKLRHLGWKAAALPRGRTAARLQVLHCVPLPSRCKSRHRQAQFTRNHLLHLLNRTHPALMWRVPSVSRFGAVVGLRPPFTTACDRPFRLSRQVEWATLQLHSDTAHRFGWPRA